MANVEIKTFTKFLDTKKRYIIWDGSGSVRYRLKAFKEVFMESDEKIVDPLVPPKRPRFVSLRRGDVIVYENSNQANSNKFLDAYTESDFKSLFKGFELRPFLPETNAGAIYSKENIDLFLWDGRPETIKKILSMDRCPIDARTLFSGPSTPFIHHNIWAEELSLVDDDEWTHSGFIIKWIAKAGRFIETDFSNAYDLVREGEKLFLVKSNSCCSRTGSDWIEVKSTEI